MTYFSLFLCVVLVACTAEPPNPLKNKIDTNYKLDSFSTVSLLNGEFCLQLPAGWMVNLNSTDSIFTIDNRVLDGVEEYIIITSGFVKSKSTFIEREKFIINMTKSISDNEEFEITNLQRFPIGDKQAVLIEVVDVQQKEDLADNIVYYYLVPSINDSTAFTATSQTYGPNRIEHQALPYTIISSLILSEPGCAHTQ